MPRRHSALLALIVAAFAIRPLLGDSGAALLLYNIVIVAILLVGLYSIQVSELVGEQEKLMAERSRRSVVGWTLGLAAVAARLATLVTPNHRIDVVGSICWLFFFAFITWHELRAVLRQQEITGETIAMSISVYLLLAFTWGLLYVLIFELQTSAFSFPATEAVSKLPSNQQSGTFPALIYFSLTTLTTIGYGDITPLSLKARYAAVAEGVIGQFYMAILVARLVGMQMMSKPVVDQTGDRARDSGR